MLGNETGLLHLRDDEVSSCKRLVRIYRRVVSCRLVDHTDKRRALLDCKIDRILAEESLSRSLDTICVAAEEDLIHVHVHDLILRIVALKLHSRDPLLELDPYHLQGRHSRDPAAHILTRIEGLGKLLGDGTSSSLARVSSEKGLEDHTSETLEVDAGMIVETYILRCYCRIHKIRRKLGIVHERPVLYMECGKDLAV